MVVGGPRFPEIPRVDVTGGYAVRWRQGASRSRNTLHDLVDRIPEAELPAAERFLEYLAVSPAYRAALSAPLDDEPVTEADVTAIARAGDEIRAGKVISHEELLREFGLR